MSTSISLWHEAAAALAIALAPTGSWELIPQLPPLPWYGQTWSIDLTGTSGVVGLMLWTQILPHGARDATAWAEVANWAITHVLEASGYSADILVACGPPQARAPETITAREIRAYGFRAPQQPYAAGALAWWRP